MVVNFEFYKYKRNIKAQNADGHQVHWRDVVSKKGSK